MMTRKGYCFVALPSEFREELDEILARAGYKTGAGFGSQRGQGVVELLRRADAVSRAAQMNDAEYLAAMRESDARLHNRPDGNE